jgi:hypothetical protein
LVVFDRVVVSDTAFESEFGQEEAE